MAKRVRYGVPPGSIIEPLLFLIQFNANDKVLKHPKIIIYADDTVMYLLCSLKKIHMKLSKGLDSFNDGSITTN